jgi:hypothetical protein
VSKKKEKRGGTRKNAGAKPKYNEETKTVAFRCPLSKVEELKIIVKSKLSEWSVKYAPLPPCLVALLLCCFVASGPSPRCPFAPSHLRPVAL